jgi:hypothetical protein
MNNNLYHLIPKQILDFLNCRHIKLKLELLGTPAEDRYPHVRIIVDQQTIKETVVVGLQSYEYEFDIPDYQDYFTLDIVYYNKKDNDTVVVQGQIIENQNISLNHIFINEIDLVETGVIHQDIGDYTMQLTNEKYQYFLDNNININPTTSLSMYENGVWSIRIGMPVWSFLTKKQQNIEIAEQIDIQPILKEIYQTVLSCKKLNVR